MFGNQIKIAGHMVFILIGIFNLALCAESEPWRVKGKVGKAVRFEKVGDRIVSKATKEIDVSKAMTIGLWVKGDFWEEGRLSSFIYKRGCFGIHKRMKQPGGGVYFWGTIAWRNTPLVWPVDKFKLKAGEWHHLAMTYDPKTCIAEGYFDGKKVSTRKVPVPHNGTMGPEIMNQDFPLILGYGRRQFFGELDSVYIYNRVLSPDEIKLIMEEKGPNGAVVAYLFNEESGDRIADSSGHGYDARYTDFSKMPRLGKKVSVNALDENNDFTAWNQAASRRVMLNDKPVASSRGAAICARAARNEFESFQIVISPKKRLSDLRFSISDLRQVGGAGVIPRKNLLLNQVAYAGITIPSQTNTGGKAVFGEAAVPWQKTYKAGMYPDPLPANKIVKVAMPDRNYTLWVTVDVPENVPAGVYGGNVTVSANDKKKDIPFRFQVWDFTLPEEFSSHNHGAFIYGLNWNAENNKSKDFTEGELENIYRNFARHHITIHPLYHEPVVEFDKEGNLTKFDTARYDEELKKVFAMGMRDFFFPLVNNSTVPRDGALPAKKWCGIPMSDGKGGLSKRFRKAFTNYIKHMSAHLKGMGLFKYFTINNMDEPHSAREFERCREFMKLYKGAEPDLKVFLTKWPFEDVYGSADIWCLGAFQPTEIKKALARGESIRCYPNWHVLIDRPLMDSRVLGWIEQKYGLTGLYIWMTDNQYWLKSDKLYVKACIYPSGRTIWGNGMLIYPDAKGHAISSIRWEMLRDTIEDFEYCNILKKLCNKLEKEGKYAREAKGARAELKKWTDKLVTCYESREDTKQSSWKRIKYELDDSILLKGRRWLANEIVKLNKLDQK